MAQAPSDATSAPPIFIFDSTRLRSHLFFRWLSTHPAVHPIYHPYLMPAMFGPSRIELAHLSCSPARAHELRETLAPLYTDDTYPRSTSHLLTAISSAHSRGHVPVVNEHWFNVLTLPTVLSLLRGDASTTTHESLPSNPTYVPDPLFDTLRPLILIRHPIPAVESIYRTALAATQQRPGGEDESFTLISRVRPLRVLFDFFMHRAEQGKGLRPLVVDGDDVLWRTDPLGKKLCAELGLDGHGEGGGLSESWEPASQEEIERMNPVVYKITERVQLSSGIERPGEGKPGEPRLEEAVQRWTAEWGGVVAGQLAALARENMPEYEYLRGFKI